jgi:aminotransferase EvaB
MDYVVRFVNYPEHYRRMWDEITGAVEDCLSRGDLIARQQLEDFETNLASFVGVKYAIGLNSGTDAILFSLIAAGVQPGHEVITVSHTFVATIAEIHHLGAKPVLIDVGEDMEMDISQIEAAITPKTKAIIPVHLNGRMCNMKAIREIADKYGIFIIEDAAQSLGAKMEGFRAGGSGLTGCFSFYPAKILGCAGDGGALVTNDDEVAEKVMLLRDHGLERKSGEILIYGYNSRLDNIQAAMLTIKLRYLPEWIERRREIAAMYCAGLEGISDLILPPLPGSEPEYYDVYQNYVIRLHERDDLADYLRNNGVEILISWPIPNHRQKALGLSNYELPVTEAVSNEVISLPMYPELSDEQVQYVIEKIRNYYN